MKFILNKDTLKIKDAKIINSGSENYYEADVEYDESWENLIIEAKIVKKGHEVGIPRAVINNKIFIDVEDDCRYCIGFVGYIIKDGIKVYQISSNLQPLTPEMGAGQIKTSAPALPTPTEWEVYIAQIQEMLDNVNGVPNGGTTGQVLAKKSNADKDVEWKTFQSGGSGTSDHSELDNLDYEHSGHTGFQPTLVSGQNIKTINNQSILGTGNINIEGGSGGGKIDDVRVDGTSVVKDRIANIDLRQSVIDILVEYGLIQLEELTEEQIKALDEMVCEIGEDGELLIQWDDKVLDIDFRIEDKDLIITNNMLQVDIEINENGELEVRY